MALSPGSSGLGLGPARGCGEGARVVSAQRAASRWWPTNSDEPGKHRTPTFGSEDDICPADALATDRFGRLDIAVAKPAPGTFGDRRTRAERLQSFVIDVSITGVVPDKHAGRNNHDGGSIITIASLNAVQPAEGMSAYCAAKARGHDDEGGRNGTRARQVRVNAIAPGLVEDSHVRSHWESMAWWRSCGRTRPSGDSRRHPEVAR